MKKMLLTVGAALSMLVPAMAQANSGEICYDACPPICNPCGYSPWYLAGGINYTGVFNHHDSLGDEYHGALGWHLYLGRKFTRCLALEIGYLYNGRETGHKLDTDTHGDGSSTSWMVPLRANYAVPLCGKLKGLLRGGVHYYNIRHTTGITAATRDTGVDFNFGLGVEWDFNCSLATRIVLDRYYRNYRSDYIDSLQWSLIYGF